MFSNTTRLFRLLSFASMTRSNVYMQLITCRLYQTHIISVASLFVCRKANVFCCNQICCFVTDKQTYIIRLLQQHFIDGVNVCITHERLTHGSDGTYIHVWAYTVLLLAIDRINSAWQRALIWPYGHVDIGEMYRCDSRPTCMLLYVNQAGRCRSFARVRSVELHVRGIKQYW